VRHALGGEQRLAGAESHLSVAGAHAEPPFSRERYLLLNHRLARRIVEAHTDWLDDVERELE
jgi:hypothetical protein